MIPNLYQRKLSKKDLKSVAQPSDDGMMKEKLPVLLPREEEDIMMKKLLTIASTLKKLTKKEKLFVMQEFQRLNNEKILIDNVNCLKNDTQELNSTKTSEVVSTSIENNLNKWWNVYSREMSKQLWLPIKTDLPDLDSRLSETFVDISTVKSWFSMKKMVLNKNSKKTCCQSLLSSLLNTMEKEKVKIKSKNAETILKTNLSSIYNVSLNGEILDDYKNIIVNSDDIFKVNDEQITIDTSSILTIKPFGSSTNRKYKIVSITDGREEAGCVKRLKIYPSSKQQELLEQTLAGCRWIYNQCVIESTKLEWDSPSDIIKNRQILRDKVTKTSALKDHLKTNKYIPKYTLNIHANIRDRVLMDVIKSYKTYITNKINAKKTGKRRPRFCLKFRTKKDISDTFLMDYRDWNTYRNNKHSILYDLLNSTELKSYNTSRNVIRKNVKEIIPDKIDYDFRIQKIRNIGYFIIIPTPIRHIPENQGLSDSKRVISIDPGVRTFMTCYNPEGIVYEFGKYDIGHIVRLCFYMDKIQSKIDTSINKKRKFILGKVLDRMRFRIKNLISDCHRRIAKWLCDNHDYIIVPRFKSGIMSSKKNRKLNSKTARNMMTWSHCRFREILLSKSREYNNVNIIITSEEYTSKTCTSCGNCKDNLGGSKTYKCNFCNITLDRDVNGARNILLKFMRDIITIVDSNYILLGPSPLLLGN